MYPRTKDTQAVRNTRLSPPALKITVIQPENGQRKLSVERDPFRGAGRVPRAKLSCSSALSHLILLPPRLNTHLLPTQGEKGGSQSLPLSLLLACCRIMLGGTIREVMRAGLPKTVGMLKYKGQGWGRRRNFAAGELWDLLLLLTHVQIPHQANTGGTETDSK